MASEKDRLSPAFGDLNPVEDPKIGRSLDTQTTSATDVIREAALGVFKKDAFENTGPLKGICLRIDNNPNDVEPNSWIAAVYGAIRITSLKVLKVRIPELHATLPEPAKYGSDAEEANKVIDMYPSFIAASEEVSSKPVAPGDIVLVDFVNRTNLSQPIYLGPVLSNPNPGAVGEKSAQETFTENKGEGGLQVDPPPGDNVLGTKNESNQIPQSVDSPVNQSVSPPAETIAQTTVNVLSEKTPPEFHEVTIDEIKRIMPRAKIANIMKYLPSLNQAMVLFEINTPKRQAAFLAQLAVETGDLKYDTELASGEAYEGRKRLGNNQPGDGPKFKGRGLLQLTGRANYTSMTKKLQALGIDVDLVEKPELATRPDISCIIAAQYFKDRNLNKFSDKGDIVAVSRGVNGGDNGLDHRIAVYNVGLVVFEQTLAKNNVDVTNIA